MNCVVFVIYALGIVAVRAGGGGVSRFEVEERQCETTEATEDTEGGEVSRFEVKAGEGEPQMDTDGHRFFGAGLATGTDMVRVSRFEVKAGADVKGTEGHGEKAGKLKLVLHTSEAVRVSRFEAERLAAEDTEERGEKAGKLKLVLHTWEAARVSRFEAEWGARAAFQAEGGDR